MHLLMPTMQPHLLHWDNNDLSRTKTRTQPNCERRRGRRGYSQQRYHVHRDGDWVKSGEVGVCVGVMEVVVGVVFLVALVGVRGLERIYCTQKKKPRQIQRDKNNPLRRGTCDNSRM
jgi:hypothetical protein